MRLHEGEWVDVPGFWRTRSFPAWR